MAIVLRYPDPLPLPSLAGYGGGPEESVLRTQMEGGPARQQQQYTRVPEIYSATFRYTGAEYAVFRSWFRHKAKSGGTWFLMKLDSGLGLEDHEVRFMGSGNKPYQWKRDGVKWLVTTTLEARQANVLTEEVLDILLVEKADSLLTAVSTYDKYVNQTLKNHMS